MKKSKNILLFCFIIVLLLVYGCKGGGGAEKIKDATSVELNDSKRTEVEQQNILERNLTNQPVNIGPRIFITQPSDDETLTGNVYKIKWVAADRNNDVLLITLEYQRLVQDKDSKIWTRRGWIRIADYQENDGEFLWNFDKISDGSFELKATVTDGTISATDTTGMFTIQKTYTGENQ